MAATVGLTGLLASNGSGNTHDLITNGGPYTATVTAQADNFDNTQFAASLASLQYVQGLKMWTVGFSSRFQGKAGLDGSVTFASGYTVGCRSYTLSVQAQEFDTTAFGAAAWKTWAPGLYQFSGSFDVDVDSTTALSDLSAPSGTGAAATFKFGDETTADDTVAGNIITTQLTEVVSIGDLNRATYAFQGSGNLTFAGDNSLITAGALGIPEEIDDGGGEVLTVTASSGRTASGNAFWTNMGISCAVGGLVDITGTLRGTGALTIA